MSIPPVVNAMHLKKAQNVLLVHVLLDRVRDEVKTFSEHVLSSCVFGQMNLTKGKSKL